MTDINIIFHFLGSGAVKVLQIIPICVVLTFIFGALIGTLQYIKVPFLKQIISIYIVIMRGIPPLVLLLLIFFSTSYGAPIAAAIFGLVLYHSAYIAEIIRGGIKSIPEGQFEAGFSLGLRFDQVMLKIILPQVWRSVIPSITGQYIILTKDTALVSAIGVMEILSRGRHAIQQAGNTFLVYFLIGLFYFTICYALEKFAGYTEKKFSIYT